MGYCIIRFTLKRMKKLLLLLYVLISLPLFERKAMASDFLVSYNVTYEVLDNSETEVYQEIKVKNLTNSIFVSSYKLNVNHIKITDIKASNKSGELKLDTSYKDGQTTIQVFFNDQVIGEGKEINWNLKYKTKDVSTKNGQVLEVTIPKISNFTNVEEYNAKLLVPDKFGDLLTINPPPILVEEKDSKRIYKFNLNQIQDSAVNATFGKYQLFNFKLTYDLKNEGFFSQEKTIALPPDIKDRQTILIKEISKKPDKLKIDKDGNHIAVFTVPPRSELQINLIGQAKIKNKRIDAKNGGRFDDLPKDLVKDYTTSKKYWETGDPKITSISKSLNEKLIVSEDAKRVYEYVLKTLSYDNSKNKNIIVERLGASKSLLKPKEAICMEFVDLFITIARSMGIPAREVNGYAYSKSPSLTPLSINLRGGDVLHSWAQYYDPKFGWVQIDPTWGETSGLDYFENLDSNHFAFVIKGLSSEYPLPAGAYKNTDREKPQVDVSFAITDDTKEEYSVKAEKVFDINFINLLLGKKKVILTNTGGQTLFDVKEPKLGKFPPMYKTKAYIRGDEITVQFKNFDGEDRELKVKLSR